MRLFNYPRWKETIDSYFTGIKVVIADLINIKIFQKTWFNSVEDNYIAEMKVLIFYRPLPHKKLAYTLAILSSCRLKYKERKFNLKLVAKQERLRPYYNGYNDLYGYSIALLYKL